jgi:peptidoglycan-associated lipoprotein
MTRRFRDVIVPGVALGLLAILLTGCPKTPGRGAPGTAGQPADGSGGSTGVGTGGSSALVGGGSTGSGPGGAIVAGGVSGGGVTLPALPVPSEFKENGVLRTVHFEFDRHTVRAEDVPILDGNARWLKAHPGTAILIEGHADSRGTSEYNLALGERRAKTARDQLIARGVEPSRITIISYGEERPTCEDPSEGCWAKNRRAHFLTNP